MPEPGNGQTRQRRRLVFERLEPRNLLAVSSSIDAIGALRIQSDSGDPITVGVSNGQVVVNGADPDSGPASASLISSIRVEAGPEGSRINLAEAVPAAFPALRTAEVDGGPGPDTLAGPRIHADWSFFGADSGQILDADTGSWPIYGFSGIENIEGSDLGDHFVFSDGATLSGPIDGGGGSDSLDFLDSSSDLSASLGGSDASGFSGQMTGIGGGFRGIDAIVGGGGTNRLVGEDADSTWTLSSTSTYRQGPDLLSFWGFLVLQGGAGSDRFELRGDALGNLSARINGGPGDDVFDFEDVVYLTGGLDGASGLDTLSYSNFETSVAVVLTGSDAGGYQGFEPLSFGGGGFSGIDAIEASPPIAGPSTLTGEDSEATWTVEDQGSYYSDTSARPLRFSGFEVLQGGSAPDTFRVSASPTPWTIDGGEPGAPPGDLLVLDARGHLVDQSPSVLSPHGSAEITYSDIETVQIENQPSSPPPPDTAPKEADVSLDQTLSSSSVAVGQTLTITLTVRNLGPDPASGVMVSDSLPPGAKLLSSSLPPDNLGSDGRTPTFALGSLNPGESRVITLSIRFDSPGQFSARALAQSENDSNASNNSASYPFLVLAPPSPPAEPPSPPVGPQITSFQRIGLLPRFTRFVVTYRNAIDWRSVATPGAFTLVAPGRDRRSGTRDDRRIHLRLVAFNPLENSVTFQPVVRIPARLPIRMIIANAETRVESEPMVGHHPRPDI